MSATSKSAIRMVNQIALNLEVLGHDAAVAATADHIAQFWDSRMKTAAFDLLNSGDAGFSETAAAALTMLRAGIHPASQTRATQFNDVNETGHSDAG